MRGEYLAFDLFVAAPILALAALRPAWFRGGWAAAILACALGGWPYLVWDAEVAGRHWWFSPERTLGPALFGLPLEELGFFLVVPFACLATWELVFTPARHPPDLATGALRGAFLAALPLAAWAASAGREYTALALAGLGAFAILDHALGTALLRNRRFFAHLGVVVVLTTVFNGYLTGRPIVLYDERFQLGPHVGPIPMEDYLFGLGLVGFTTAIYQRLRGRRPEPSWIGRLIRWRFGGYRHVVSVPDAALPPRLDQPVPVVVLGAGLAGLGAATLLAERGFAVTLLEKNRYLGGKVGAWNDVADDGESVPVEHGFHAFFRHYYNLDDWLSSLGVRQRLRAIEDYVIFARDGRRHRFAGVDTTPVLNLVSLGLHGLYRFRDVLQERTSSRLEAFLRYDPATTPGRWDGTSYARFADDADLPADLRLVFSTFARAFFADEDRISMAALIRSFHFYYLSHDHGLAYDYVQGSYTTELLAPIQAALDRLGVATRLGVGVRAIEGGPGAWTVVPDEGEPLGPFAHVVLATNVAAAAAIAAASPALAAAAPRLPAALAATRSGQRYAVLRLWVEGPVSVDEPVFVVTERARALDAIAFVDRTDADAQAWAEAHRGAVIEAHCYAVPDDLADDAVGPAIEAELREQIPTLGRIVRRHLQLRNDFTAFHVGLYAERPEVTTAASGLWCAGDWVALPFPAMLMEAAHASGRLAANAIAAAHGVRGAPVWSVPPTGFLHGVPEAPRKPQRAPRG